MLSPFAYAVVRTNCNHFIAIDFVIVSYNIDPEQFHKCHLYQLDLIRVIKR